MGGDWSGEREREMEGGRAEVYYGRRLPGREREVKKERASPAPSAKTIQLVSEEAFTTETETERQTPSVWDNLVDTRNQDLQSSPLYSSSSLARNASTFGHLPQRPKKPRETSKTRRDQCDQRDQRDQEKPARPGETSKHTKASRDHRDQ